MVHSHKEVCYFLLVTRQENRSAVASASANNPQRPFFSCAGTLEIFLGSYQLPHSSKQRSDPCRLLRSCTLLTADPARAFEYFLRELSGFRAPLALDHGPESRRLSASSCGCRLASASLVRVGVMHTAVQSTAT